MRGDGAAGLKKRFPSNYKGDGSHPSVRGACFVASVFLEEVLGVDPQTTGAPQGVSDEEFGQILSVVLSL